MFFTRTGKIIAWLAIALGCLRIVLALGIIQLGDPSAAADYLGRTTTGQAINQGIYTILFGIVLGILAEISRSIAEAPKDQE